VSYQTRGVLITRKTGKPRGAKQCMYSYNNERAHSHLQVYYCGCRHGFSAPRQHSSAHCRIPSKRQAAADWLVAVWFQSTSLASYKDPHILSRALGKVGLEGGSCRSWVFGGDPGRYEVYGPSFTFGESGEGQKVSVDPNARTLAKSIGGSTDVGACEILINGKKRGGNGLKMKKEREKGARHQSKQMELSIIASHTGQLTR
jgi:hypothetical protein